MVVDCWSQDNLYWYPEFCFFFFCFVLELESFRDENDDDDDSRSVNDDDVPGGNNEENVVVARLFGMRSFVVLVWTFLNRVV